MSRVRAGVPQFSLPLLVGLLAAPGILLAQQPGDTTSLPEIVVTATRYPVAADSVAASVSVLRGDDLRARGLRFVNDALREVPGVQVVQGGPFGAATSVFVRGGESDYVKVLVDGVPVNQPGGFYDFGSLTTDNVERIEILRGPGSVLYGSDAISGVIQVVTREGQDRIRLGLGGEAGSFGTTRWEASALGGGGRILPGTGGWSASLSRLTSDGTYAFNNDYRNTVASGRIHTQAGERTEVGLSARYHDAVYHFPTDFTGVPVDHNQFSTDQTLTLSLDASHRLSHAVEAELLLGRSDIATDYVNPPDPPPGPDDESVSRIDTDRTSAEGRLQLRLPGGVRGVAGTSYEHQRQNAQGSFDTGRNNWGVYAQATALPVRRLQLTAGGRLDRNERFGSFWTYRAAALAFATPATRIRASVGTGFKEPGFFENFTTPFSVGNPGLRPERTFGVDGGIEQDLARRRLGVVLTFFAQRFRDLIQYTFATASPEDPNYFNVAAANASGLEATLQLRPAGPVRGSISYSHVTTRVTDAGFDSGEAATFVEGERLLRRPADAVAVRVDGQMGERLRLGASVSWVGNRDDVRPGAFPEPSQRIVLPAYTTVDLSATAALLRERVGTPGLDLTARVENLFDRDYEQAVGFPARGRGLFVGLASHVR